MGGRGVAYLMAATRLPYRREHTGTRQGDGMQRPAQEVANRHGADLANLTRAMGVGILRIELKDEDRTLTSDEEACMQLAFTGRLTASRRLRISDATDVTAFMRWMTNLTSGGFALTIANTNGSATLANGTTSAVMVSASGPGLLT